MRHGFANKKLNRTSEHRKALLKNMLNSLIKYEQIKTTLPKAKFLRPQADKIITLGKKDTLQNTKMLVSKLQDIKSANKVKKTLSKRYEKRSGGYTRIIKAGFRFVPNGVVRKGAFIAKNVVLMPSFVNIGAYVDEGSMIDTWASVGSCAQVGKNCHISGGAGIGGVLEPMQANPTIVEDNCFVGARAEIAEGVIVEKGSVLSMGVYIGASTRIIDRATGEIIYGKVPAYSVVVPGTLPGKKEGSVNPSLYCAVIVKRVDEKTRSKTSINDLLRD